MKKLLKIYSIEWNKAQKNPSGSYHFRLMYRQKNLNFYSHKNTTLQELRPGDSERRLEYCNWFLNNLNDDRFLIMNLN
jgi:hypothetical protein